MKLLLASLNFAPELTGIGKYNGEMAPWFVLQGDDVSVLCAPPYYPEWQVHSGFNGKRFATSVENGVSVTRCPTYVPAQPTTVKRLVHLASFAFSSGVALFGRLCRSEEHTSELQSPD